MMINDDYLLHSEANMLYLESPAGVGFSYSANESFYEFLTDEITGSFTNALSQVN